MIVVYLLDNVLSHKLKVIPNFYQARFVVEGSFLFSSFRHVYLCNHDNSVGTGK